MIDPAIWDGPPRNSREMEPEAIGRRSGGALGFPGASDELRGTSMQSEEYLEPYDLSPEDEHTVMMWAWGKQCVDCGDVRDYYMVYDHVWKEAGLDQPVLLLQVPGGAAWPPAQTGDFTYCPVNHVGLTRAASVPKT